MGNVYCGCYVIGNKNNSNGVRLKISTMKIICRGEQERSKRYIVGQVQRVQKAGKTVRKYDIRCSNEE